jgi:predicted phosphodiesterase
MRMHMRIALISDIHGNLVSLEAVLTDIGREQVDRIVCLGDVATMGPQPGEVVARLRALEITGIVGNHDADLFGLDLIREDVDAPPWTVEILDRCANQLSKADLDYLRSFRPLIEIPLGAAATLLCFHGSPRSNEDMILATTPTTKLDKMLKGYSAGVMACGHTHVQMVRQHRGVMIVNAGSVGQPLEQMPFDSIPHILPWAEYGIISWKNGILSTELRRVSIDLDAYKGAVLKSDMPDGIKRVWASAT